MATDKKEPEQGVYTAKPPAARAIALRERQNIVDIALKLAEVYEFAAHASGANHTMKLIEQRPIMPHSWSKVSSVGAKNKTFKLADSDKFDIDLPTGVTVVIGKSGSGKSRLAFDHLFYTAALDRNNVPLYIRAFEPGDLTKIRSFTTDITHVDVDFEIDLAETLANALADPRRDLIIVDSLRYLFYTSSGGATGKGGVNMGLFMDLTHLDIVADAFGKRVIVIINPMTDDDAAFNFYVEAAVGAVSGVIVVDNYKSGRISNRLKSNREFAPMPIPARAATDKVAVASGKASVESIGHARGANPSVNASVFGRNR